MSVSKAFGVFTSCCGPYLVLTDYNSFPEPTELINFFTTIHSKPAGFCYIVVHSSTHFAVLH